MLVVSRVMCIDFPILPALLLSCRSFCLLIQDRSIHQVLGLPKKSPINGQNRGSFLFNQGCNQSPNIFEVNKIRNPQYISKQHNLESVFQVFIISFFLNYFSFLKCNAPPPSHLQSDSLKIEWMVNEYSAH